ncbi:MAG: hypothetical protein AAF721_33640 [Myxococcota bacterium]
MGRVWAAFLGAWVGSAACRPTPASTPGTPVPPATAPRPPAEAPPEPEAPEPEPPSRQFAVTVSSECPEVWHASLVRRDKEAPLSGTSRFDASNEPRTLQLQPGDALVLTNENGAIMAIDFDDVTPDKVANVVVVEDCSGVQKTVARAP